MTTTTNKLTLDMPTQFGSSIYQGSAPEVDAASIIILRQAGALILGKTTTTEFAATTQGTQTTNPHDPLRTPGGSSSGSGAAIADFQAPIGLGTQTGGSTIRPGSFNGIYAIKPTWNAISREGQKVYSIILDTIGLYARSAADLDLLADVFALQDDDAVSQPFNIDSAKFAICKTMAWDQAGAGTAAAMEKAKELLKARGAQVEHVDLPGVLNGFSEWYSAVINSEGRTSFLSEYRTSKTKISSQLIGQVENKSGISRAAQLAAFDKIAVARPVMDELIGQYAAFIVPSVPDEAPLGLESTGSAAFNLLWTVGFSHSIFDWHKDTELSY